MGDSDTVDEPDPDETDPEDGPIVPVDGIYDEAEVDPETGAFLVVQGQTVMGTEDDDLFSAIEGADYRDASISISAGSGDDTIDLDLAPAPITHSVE